MYISLILISYLSISHCTIIETQCDISEISDLDASGCSYCTVDNDCNASCWPPRSTFSTLDINSMEMIWLFDEKEGTIIKSRDAKGDINYESEFIEGDFDWFSQELRGLETKVIEHNGIIGKTAIGPLLKDKLNTSGEVTISFAVQHGERATTSTPARVFAWAYHQALVNQNIVIGIDTIGNNPATVASRYDTFEEFDARQFESDIGVEIPHQELTFWASTFSSDETVWYFNGNTSQTDDYGGETRQLDLQDFSDPNHPLYLLARHRLNTSVDRWFSGYISHLAVYSKALTETQIHSLYDQGFAIYRVNDEGRCTPGLIDENNNIEPEFPLNLVIGITISITSILIIISYIFMRRKEEKEIIEKTTKNKKTGKKRSPVRKGSPDKRKESPNKKKGSPNKRKESINNRIASGVTVESDASELLSRIGGSAF